MKYIPKKQLNKNAICQREMYLLGEHYDFLQYRTKNGVLQIKGSNQPTELSDVYHYTVRYEPPFAPVVKVKRPVIAYDDEIHMYPKDNSLCLYHESDLKWDESYHLFDTIIPWTHEWFVYYELWKISGVWQHPYFPHVRGDNRRS